MSNTENMVTSQIFYYIKRDTNESVYAYDASEGLTVPIFSSVDLARGFLERSRVRGHGVAMISPTQMAGFADACKDAGAKFLQLDPQPEVLKNAKVKNIGGSAADSSQST
ncbi:MAG: hypothetical protein AB1489_18615 [Acidobacteriota bacterium]